MTTIIPIEEFQRVEQAALSFAERLELLADMSRLNALSAVKRAGSGHLGSSFSAMDVVVWLYYHRMNVVARGFDHPERDIYFSSKGHDVPGLYAVLYALGVVPRERFLRLRRLGGLDGHPDVGIPGIEANSGSLGMGISKGKGMAWARKRLGRAGTVYVMVGDGELQEGQNYEAMQTAPKQGIDNLTVIVDCNKVQSDKLTCEIIDVEDIGAKFEAFGWAVERVDGHDYATLESAADRLERAPAGRPRVIIADTLKGRGVSFMEHPKALDDGEGLYPWHAGAPDDRSYAAAHAELVTRIEERLLAADLEALALEHIAADEFTGRRLKAAELVGEPVSQAARSSGVTQEYVAAAYGEALVAAMRRRPDLVVLDADLASDCRIRACEAAFPERFIENGIAEQDMVSMAGGVARQGLLPVVNSFASFLASRANEQIYNNATEKTRIIYGMHYAGLIPAGPGKSHQSLRDVSLLGALPNMVILQPANADEARMVVDYTVDEATVNCAIRLAIGPSPRRIELPAHYRLTLGRGVTLRAGSAAVMFAYGPVMLHEALRAAEILEERGFAVQLVNMPWLNRVDAEWIAEIVRPHSTIFVLEDHAPVGGLADRLLESLVDSGSLGERSFHRFAVEGHPACGTPPEALKEHGLDGGSLADRIEAISATLVRT